MTQALDRSNCGIARSRGKEASVKPDEPTNRKVILFRFTKIWEKTIEIIWKGRSESIAII
jgi:hypothetical protein